MSALVRAGKVYADASQQLSVMSIGFLLSSAKVCPQHEPLHHVSLVVLRFVTGTPKILQYMSCNSN